MTTATFWDHQFSSSLEQWDLGDHLQLAVDEAAKYFGNLEGKELIDLGCGNGAASLFFSRLGARVISLDQSEVAISSSLLKNALTLQL